MKIAIIGTGGVGGYFGAKLNQAGHDVTFLARGEHLKAMQTRGLEVRSILGDFRLDHVHATDNIKELGDSDIIILGIKAWQVREIAPQLPQIMNDHTVVLPLQNGVMASEELMEHLPAKHVLGGLCRIISKIEAPGVIHHMSVTPTIIFGELNNERTERVTSIHDLFTKAGIASKVATDIQAELWRKFIYICFSGLLAVTRSTYGQVRELKETRQMTIDLFTEIYVLSQKMGINIESNFVEKTIASIDEIAYDMTTSLARDVWDGKPSEIEYQNGTVVRLGLKYGVPTPVNKFIYECILPMEKRARGK
jgi:2-dehydropantoate 2-reductase